MLFGENRMWRVPPSLVNIYKELHDDLGMYNSKSRMPDEVGGAGSAYAEYGT